MRSVTGKLSATGEVLIRLERAAMIHFGVPSFGVHLNGYVKATGECGGKRFDMRFSVRFFFFFCVVCVL